MAAKFFSFRAKEINTLSAEISKPTDMGLAFQNVPHRCRRRAASHHLNRIPLRLREFHTNIEPGGKRPSKKYRKRKKMVERTSSHNRLSQTHTWHAKRFHMTNVQGNWTIPQKANEKNFRRVYRSVNASVYLEDLSYWQCIELQCDYEKLEGCFGNSIIDGVKVKHGQLHSHLREGHEKLCWLYSKGSKQQLLGQTWMQAKNEALFWMWCQPKSFDKTLEYLNEQTIPTTCLSDLCRFRLLGPKSNEMLGLLSSPASSNGQVIKQPALNVVSEDSDKCGSHLECIFKAGQRDSGFGSGWDVISKGEQGRHLWHRLVHRGAHVGCLTSQDQVDVEMMRLSSQTLSPDTLLSSNHEDHGQLQAWLLILVNKWTPNQDSFMVVRDSLSLIKWQKCLESNQPLRDGAVNNLGRLFLPIVVDMINGGSLSVGSTIYYPTQQQQSSTEKKEKYAQDILEVPFLEDPVIGIVTTSTFSQRRGVSSGLGLISAPAIQRFLLDGSLKESSVIALSINDNGKKYLAKFKLLQN